MKKLLLILGIVCLMGCNNASRNEAIGVDLIQNPNSAEGYDETVKMPVMTFDCDKHDFGRLTAGESITYSFHFTNTGNADLVIGSCTSTCGCTVASFPKERIVPGAEGYIAVSFQSAGKSGQQYQEVTVVSNAQPARQKLIILAQVGI